MSTIIPFTFPETGQRLVLPEFQGEPIIKGLEGHLYVVEFDSNGVKVGFTSNPQARLTTHMRSAKNFGRRAVRGVFTTPHVEARKNEFHLIRACRAAAGLADGYTGEYFPISLDQAAKFIADLPQSRGDRASFEAESAARDNRLIAFFESMWGKRPVRFGPVFPWAVHMHATAVDEFVSDLRDALEEPDPLAAIDHVALKWFMDTAAELAAEASVEGGAR